MYRRCDPKGREAPKERGGAIFVGRANNAPVERGGFGNSTKLRVGDAAVNSEPRLSGIKWFPQF